MLSRENTNYDIFHEEDNTQNDSVDLHIKKDYNILHSTAFSINIFCCYFFIFISILGMLLIMYYYFY